MKVGNKIFYAGEPVIYFDTLKTSSLEQAATTVYAQGGRGNARLVSWDGEKTVTFTMEDALISPEGLMILSGAGLISGEDKTITVHATERSSDVVFTTNGAYVVVSKPVSTDPNATCYVMFADDDEIKTEPFIALAVTKTDELPASSEILGGSLEGSYTKKDTTTVSTAGDIEKGVAAKKFTNEDVVGVLKAAAFDSNGSDENVVATHRVIRIVTFDAATLRREGTGAEGYEPVDIKDTTKTGLYKKCIALVDYYTDMNGAGVQQINIGPESFGGNFYVEASTLFRTEKGADVPAEFIIPNARVQSNFTFSMASSGDPSTFTFTMDAFPDYTRFDKTQKVFSAIQVIGEATADAAVVRTKTAHDKKHDAKFD